MSVTRNTTFNLLGTAAPILIALISIPVYLNLVGEQRYGMLSIAWLLLGYFGAFDLGIGRAAAQRIAKLEHAHTARARSFWTALCLNTALGGLGGLAIWPVANYFFARQFQIDADLQPEVLEALPWLMLALPLATITGVLSGALQGVERFLQLNVINAAGSILFQILPLIAAWLWTPDLGVLMPIAIGARLIGVVFLFFACINHVSPGAAPSFSRNEARKLLRFGGWVTVSSLISPFMVMADRFIIGAMLGAKAVTHYTVPFQVAERTTIIPGALSSSLFPRFAKDAAQNSQQLAESSLRLVLVIMTPMIVVAILLAHPLLVLWISNQFADQSALVLQILLAGFWVNGLARIPHAKLVATGRPKVVAICHLLEILPYLVLLFVGLHFGGVAGSAMAFSLRVLADHLLLSAYANILRSTFVLTLSGVSLLVAAVLVTELSMSIYIKSAAGILLVLMAFLWSAVQAPDALKLLVRKSLSRA